jgi:Na+/H+ antiporter NhaD/arsenite permease-like protein
VDWTLLVFFSGLFIVTGALETSGLSDALFEAMLPLVSGGVLALTGVSVVLSNLISNVPAVLLFRPVIADLPDPQHSWLVLAMATTLAGNLTILGSVANLIVAEIARRSGEPVGFGEYLKAGVPITLLTLAFGVFWLSLF